jgi:hypothetical protein
MTAVLVDAANETYELPGQFSTAPEKKSVGLGKVALDKIAQAAGVSWDPRGSGRTDDGSDPHYCAWLAVGAVRHFDGSEVRLMGSKEMDLRDGSPQCEAIIERCIKKASRPYEGPAPKPEEAERIGHEKARNQIREMRLHILGHAETKARLRAIRALGIRSSYKLAELQKPFVVAKLIWTGQSEDPQLRRDFAHMTATAMLGGARALYGEPAPAPALPGPRGVHGAPPPALGTTGGDPDDLGPDQDGEPPICEKDGTVMVRREDEPEKGFTCPACNERVRKAREGAAPAAPPAAASAAAALAAPEASAKIHLPGKKDAVKPLLKDAEEKDLRYWQGRLREDLDEERSRRPAEDKKVLDAIDAELAFREGKGGGAAPAPGKTPY